MDTVKAGDTVRIHYEGRTPDGMVFDASTGEDPMEFTLGQDLVITGVENALIGMHPGEEKTVAIPPKDAYGERRADLVLEVERSQLGPEIDPQEGMIMEIQSSDGATSMNVTLGRVTETTVVLDANHPLAGQTLTFTLKMLEIVTP